MKTINAGTTGAITLDVTNGALSGTAADLVLAFAGTVTTHTGTVTITDAPDVSELKAINAATTGAITLNVTNGALSGSSSDLVLAFDGTVTEHTGTVTITNADYTLAQLATINAATTGAITLNTNNTALSGTSSEYSSAFAGTINYDGNLTISNADYTAAELVNINNGTTGTITLNTTNTALSGTASDLVTAFSGTITEHTGAVTITDAPSVSQLKTINAATTGAIILNVTNGALSGTSSDLALAFAGTVTEHTGTVAITNTDYTVDQLKTINNASTGAITFSTAGTALSGTSSDLAIALAGTTNHSGTVTITNADYTAAELATINNGTSGSISLSTAGTALSGTSSSLAASLAGTTNNTGAVTITNADYTVAELVTINAGTTGDITLNTTNTALSGTSSDLVLAFAGTVTEHTGAVTITNADYTVAELVSINAATTGAITLSNAGGALSGTSADLVLAFDGTVTEHTGTIGITNADYTVAQLKTINAASTGAITFTTTTALSDTSSNLAIALNGTTNHNASVTVTNTDYTPAQLATLTTEQQVQLR